MADSYGKGNEILVFRKIQVSVPWSS